MRSKSKHRIIDRPFKVISVYYNRDISGNRKNTKRGKPNKKNKVDDRKHVMKFNVPIYDRDIRIVVCEDIRTSLEFISYKEFDGEEDWVEATVIEDNKGFINIVIKPNASINTICHESLHVVSFILSHAGMKFSEKSEEGYAYLIGYIAEKIEKGVTSYNTIDTLDSEPEKTEKTEVTPEATLEVTEEKPKKPKKND